MLLIRYFLILLFLLMPFSLQAVEKIRLGLTPVFVNHQGKFIREWQNYLTEQVQQPIEFVQRASYQEIMQLLLDGQLDAAWICGYPFVRYQNQLELMAAPSFQGKPLYRAYIIVPSQDTSSQTISDLKGKVFAFSDPNSNSGYLYPRFLVWQTGEAEQGFFSRSFFTGSHNNVIDAVANGLAQGGAVDGYVWESMLKTNPELVSKTRIITQSERFGHPPIVSHQHTHQSIKDKLSQALLSMQDTPTGQKLLNQLNLDGFVETSAQRYSEIESIMFILGEPTHLFTQEQP